ncbi:MAG: CHASE domain-containing protein [Bacteriovoracaceae bacterium]
MPDYIDRPTGQRFLKFSKKIRYSYKMGIFKKSLISSKRKTILFFVVALLCSLTISLGLHLTLRKNQEVERLNKFSKFADKIQAKLVYFDSVLGGIAGTQHILKYQLDTHSFYEYSKANHFFKNMKGSLGFGFIRKVNNKNKDAYLNLQTSKNPGFKPRYLKDSNTKQIDHHFYIELIEPNEKNPRARGLDVASEKNRREAAIRAMLTGKPSLTKKIQLVQSDKKEAGFLYFYPIYSSITTPQNEQEREQLLEGWAYTPILASHLAEIESDSIFKVKIFQEKIDDSSLILSNSKDNFMPQWSKTISMGGQNWIIQGALLKNRFFKRSYNIISVLVFIISLLFFSIIFYYYKNLESQIEMKNEILAKAKQEVSVSQAELINQKNFLYKIIDSLPALIGYWDKDLNNKISNKAYLEYFGKTQSEIQNRHISEVLGTEIYQKNLPYINGVLEGIPQQFERAIPTPSGKVKFTLANYIPDIKDGIVEGFFVIVLDISKIKELENERELYQAKLVNSAKLASMGEMASGLAHEINNPLSIITGKISILKEQIETNEFNEKQKEKYILELTKIENTCDRIIKIIKGLHSFSREKDKVPMEIVEIGPIIEETLAFCKERFKSHDIPLNINYENGLFLNCRPTQISQIILNLLNNAHDAVENLEEKWVNLDCHAMGDYIHISVTDSGHGIPEKIRAKIMQPFFTTKEIGKGTGLGLSISLGMAQQHNGFLYYDTASKTTRFVLALPLSRK